MVAGLSCLTALPAEIKLLEVPAALEFYSLLHNADGFDSALQRSFAALFSSHLKPIRRVFLGCHVPVTDFATLGFPPPTTLMKGFQHSVILPEPGNSLPLPASLAMLFQDLTGSATIRQALEAFRAGVLFPPPHAPSVSCCTL